MLHPSFKFHFHESKYFVIFIERIEITISTLFLLERRQIFLPTSTVRRLKGLEKKRREKERKGREIVIERTCRHRTGQRECRWRERRRRVVDDALPVKHGEKIQGNRMNEWLPICSIPLWKRLVPRVQIHPPPSLPPSPLPQQSPRPPPCAHTPHTWAQWDPDFTLVHHLPIKRV